LSEKDLDEAENERRIMSEKDSLGFCASERGRRGFEIGSVRVFLIIILYYFVKIKREMFSLMMGN
jgi:hypothetical protein